MTNNLHRTAIVTGAGKRVGRMIAEGLAADGWHVIAHVHHDSDDAPKSTLKVVADLADPGCAKTIFDAAGGQPVSLLINNAARFAFDSLEEFSVAEFDSHMAVNVRAPMLLMREFARRHGGGDGLVVNILDSKVVAPNPDFMSYTLSKHALAAGSELAAQALADKAIRVNAVAPALMLRSPGQSETNFRAMHEANPLHRGVEPKDVLATVRYFIDAGTVTGQCLTIDAGQRFLRLGRDVQFLGEQ